MTDFVNSYAELYSPNARRTLRNIAGYTLYNLNRRKHNETLRTPRVQILELHYLFPDEEIRFRKLLDFLVDTDHKFISFSQAVQKIETGKINDNYISFTFDDGYHNCLKAASILAEYDATACFYLNSNIVGEKNSELIERHCLERINKPPVKFMNWDDIETIQKQNHEIGGHTKSHYRLSELPQSELEVEIKEDKEIIESYCGSIEHFAWPYGTMNDITEQSKDIVYGSGYRSCSSAVRGAHFTECGENCFIHRDHVIAGWPHGHILYMLARSVRKSHSNHGKWNFQPTA